MKLLLLNIFLTGLTKDVVQEVTLFKCNKCGRKKRREDFYKKKNGKIKGYSCKKCSCLITKAYSQSEAGRAANKKWEQSEVGKAIRKKYKQSEAGIAKRKEYEQSEAGKASIKKATEKYNKSDVGKATAKAWEQSEAGKATKKAYRESEKGKNISKAYRQSEAGKAANKKWNHSEIGKAMKKAYRESEAGKIAMDRGRAKRKGRDAFVINDLTIEQWHQIIEGQGNCCNGCKVSFGKTTPCKDHIIPVIDGGGSTKNNIQALCAPCNSTKGVRSMEHLLEQLGKRDKE